MIDVPSWFRKDKEEGVGTVGELPPLPTEARLPEIPNFSEADHEAKIYSDAAVQLHRHRKQVADLEKEKDDLRVQLAEATLGHNGNHKKIVALELENNQLRTDIQTLQSDLNDLKRYLSLQKQVYDRFNIKAPEKKPRKKKEKKPEPETPAGTA